MIHSIDIRVMGYLPLAYSVDSLPAAFLLCSIYRSGFAPAAATAAAFGLLDLFGAEAGRAFSLAGLHLLPAAMLYCILLVAAAGSVIGLFEERFIAATLLLAAACSIDDFAGGFQAGGSLGYGPAAQSAVLAMLGGFVGSAFARMQNRPAPAHIPDQTK